MRFHIKLSVLKLDNKKKSINKHILMCFTARIYELNDKIRICSQRKYIFVDWGLILFI